VCAEGRHRSLHAEAELTGLPVGRPTITTPGWRDSVPLAPSHGGISQLAPSFDAEEEHSRSRTRGIPGYTGCQPRATTAAAASAGASGSRGAQADASRWTTISAANEPRPPRAKGIPGGATVCSAQWRQAAQQRAATTAGLITRCHASCCHACPRAQATPGTSRVSHRQRLATLLPRGLTGATWGPAGRSSSTQRPQ
jgi:hypothetical protein